MDLKGQRLDYFGALEWAGGLTATAPGQMDAPTPCEQFAVRELTGHLIGTAYRSTGDGPGHLDPPCPPHVVADVADSDLAAAYVSITRDIRKLWQSAADGDRVTAPWGACTALDALRGSPWKPSGTGGTWPWPTASLLV